MANPSTAITALESKRRKAALESKLRQLRGAFRERDDLRIEYMADPNDQIRSSYNREMTIHRLDQQTRLIHDVKSALARMDERKPMASANNANRRFPESASMRFPGLAFASAASPKRKPAAAMESRCSRMWLEQAASRICGL